MSCAEVCLSHDYDGEGCDFSVERTLRSRKDHKCCECREQIRKGSQYERSVGKWDGDFLVFRTCAVCVEIRTAFVCGGYAFGALWESMQDEMFPVWAEAGPWDCLAKLTTPEAVAFCTRRFDQWTAECDQ